jgi:hypothetical protein
MFVSKIFIFFVTVFFFHFSGAQAQKTGIIFSLQDFRFSGVSNKILDTPTPVAQLPKSSSKISNGHYQAGISRKVKKNILMFRIGYISNYIHTRGTQSRTALRYYSFNYSARNRGYSVTLAGLNNPIALKKISFSTGLEISFKRQKTSIKDVDVFYKIDDSRVFTEVINYRFPYLLSMSVGSISMLNYRLSDVLLFGFDFGYCLEYSRQKGVRDEDFKSYLDGDLIEELYYPSSVSSSGLTGVVNYRINLAFIL